MRWFVLLLALLLPASAHAQKCKWPVDCSGEASSGSYTAGDDTNWAETTVSDIAAALDELALRDGGSAICEATEAILRGNIIAVTLTPTVSDDGVLECEVMDKVSEGDFESLTVLGIALDAAASGERFSVLRYGPFPFWELIPNGGPPDDCDGDYDAIADALLAVDTECFDQHVSPGLYIPWGIYVEDGGADDCGPSSDQRCDVIWVVGNSLLAAPFANGIGMWGTPLRYVNTLNTVLGAVQGLDDYAQCDEKLYASMVPTVTKTTDDYMNPDPLNHSGSQTEDDEDTYDIITSDSVVGSMGYLDCSVDVAPGAGDEWKMTVRMGAEGNLANTALTCTIDGDSTLSTTTCLNYGTKVSLVNTNALTIVIDSGEGATDPETATKLGCSFCLIR